MNRIVANLKILHDKMGDKNHSGLQKLLEAGPDELFCLSIETGLSIFELCEIRVFVVKQSLEGARVMTPEEMQRASRALDLSDLN